MEANSKAMEKLVNTIADRFGIVVEKAVPLAACHRSAAEHSEAVRRAL